MSEKLTSTSHENAVLGLIGYGKLTTFARLARDSANSPRIQDQARLARLAALALTDLDEVEALLAAAGVDPQQAMAPFFLSFADVDARTRPTDWWERLVKSYVIVGLLIDYQRFAAAGLPEQVSARLLGSITDGGFADFVVDTLDSVLAAEHVLAARLGLWGRRVHGDALSSLLAVVRAHPQLQRAGSSDEALFEHLQQSHIARFERLGVKI